MFIPPQNVSVFSIDLFGAGTGGYDYFDVKSISPSSVSINPTWMGLGSSDPDVKYTDNSCKTKVQNETNTFYGNESCWNVADNYSFRPLYYEDNNDRIYYDKV